MARRLIVALALTLTSSFLTRLLTAAPPPLQDSLVLDPTFGGQGIAEAPYEFESPLHDATRTAQGALLGVGTTSGGGVGLVKFTPDGQPDPTFGDGGLINFTVSTTSRDGATTVDVDSQGRIIIGGCTTPESSVQNAFFGRFRPDGSPDPTFGTNGLITHDLGAFECVRDLALQPDGKLVAVLTGTTGHSEGRGSVIVRLLANGSLDPAFGQVGQISDEYATTIRLFLDTSGRIVAGGRIDSDTANGLQVRRYLADGSLDTSYGDNGSFLLSGVSTVYSLAATANGGTVAAGVRGGQLIVVRITAAGLPAGSFGTMGVVTPDDPRLQGLTLSGLYAHPDGRVTVTGGSPYGALARDGFLLRLQNNGTPDPTFGDDGIVSDGFTAFDSVPRILADAQGNLYLPGAFTTAAVQKRTPDGAPDRTFGVRGSANDSPLALRHGCGGRVAKRWPDSRGSIRGLRR